MAYKKITGIYKIECTANSRLYIGSAVSIRARWASHKSQLRRGVHINRHLQNSWAKYGENAFSFTIVEQCSIDELISAEQNWIIKLDAANPSVGMNNTIVAANTLGFKHTAETRARLKEIAQNRDHSRLRALSDRQRGKPAHNKGVPGRKWTEEERQQASATRKGRPAWNKGIVHSAETKAKISASTIKTRQTIPDSTREKIKELRNTGLSFQEIANATGISLSQCHKITHNVHGIYKSIKQGESTQVA